MANDWAYGLLLNEMKIINPSEKIITERLQLRRLKTDDAENVFRFAGNSKNTKYMAWKTHNTVEDSKKVLEKTGFLLKEKKEAWHPFPNIGQEKYDAFYFEYIKQ